MTAPPLGATQVIKPGESVMTVEVNIYDDATGKLVAQGTHIKVNWGGSEEALPSASLLWGCWAELR